MFAGGKSGVSFSIHNLLWIAVAGNFLLALYAASLGWIAARSGLNTVLMGRFCFGRSAANWLILYSVSPNRDGMHGVRQRSLFSENSGFTVHPNHPLDGVVGHSFLYYRSGWL